jgi:hypothetical protein
MATVNKDFKIKNGLIVEGSTATVNGHDVLTESIVDAKGDLLVASGADEVTKLTVGTDNYILTADSSTATGVKWAAPQAVGEFGASITFEGATANAYETTLEVVDPTADRTITLPNASGTVTLNDATQTLSNKTISYTDNTITVQVANVSDLSASASELNTLDGITASTAELNILDGVTASTAEINLLDGVTATTAELNILDGVTATAAELNILDGATLTTTELNYVDGVTSAIQTQLDAKATATDLSNHISDTSTHGVTGAIVGTSDAQTISNKTLGSDLSAGNYKITSLGTPTQSTDAATKAYVDSVTEGLHIHASAVAATTANISMSNDLEVGDVIDGVTLATGDRVLVKNQNTASENGIYVVQATGAAVRALDFDQPAEVDGGDFIFVTGGTVNDNTGWVQTSTGVTTIGTDPIYFTQFSGAGTYLAGNGLTLTGNTFTIDTTVTTDLTSAQTLTNKTLTSPVITGAVFNDGSVVFEGSSADAHETTLQVTNPTADRTITFKDASGTVAFTSDIPSTTDGLSEGSSNLYFTDERAQDAVAAAIAAGTHSNITITYDDSTNKFTFAAENGVADSTTDNLTEGSTNQYFTAERAQDAIADAIAAGTHSNITITYDDNLNKFTFAAENGVADSDTDDLAEGTTNLYFTNTRAVDALEAVVPNFTEIDINSVATQVATMTQVPTASTATAYQFAKADYRSGKFLIKAEAASHTEISEILVTLDSSDNVAITEYAIVGTNGNLFDVTADVSGANVRIRVTTVNNSTVVYLFGTLII